VSFSPQQLRLLREPSFAVVATLRPDGSVHQTVMWVDADDETLLLNTASPVKQAHLAADPRIAVLVLSTSDPYSYIAVNGLASLRESGAIEHANALARKYGRAGTFAPDDTRRRVVIAVRPQAAR
jgi:PPOX class probable F420-dependent enzyme